jgi:GTPase SAR1 family protein
LIHLWSLDPPLLFGKPAAPTVTCRSAKVVLVGESNVGKSYLAHRIAMGQAPETGTIQSTHGMKFWPLKPELYLRDTTVVLMLLDLTRGNKATEEVEAWNKQLAKHL